MEKHISNGVNIDHPQIKELEYNNITNGIYIGTNQCCQTHFDEELKKEGITADISLEEDRLDAPFGVDFYVWIPTIHKLRNWSIAKLPMAFISAQINVVKLILTSGLRKRV